MRHSLPSSPIPLLSRLLFLQQQHQQQQLQVLEQQQPQQQPDEQCAQLQDFSGLVEVLVLVSAGWLWRPATPSLLTTCMTEMPCSADYGNKSTVIRTGTLCSCLGCRVALSRASCE
jgi:hypothetical protein